jgi:hypothetical protein
MNWLLSKPLGRLIVFGLLVPFCLWLASEWQKEADQFAAGPKNTTAQNITSFDDQAYITLSGYNNGDYVYLEETSKWLGIIESSKTYTLFYPFFWNDPAQQAGNEKPQPDLIISQKVKDVACIEQNNCLKPGKTTLQGRYSPYFVTIEDGLEEKLKEGYTLSDQTHGLDASWQAAGQELTWGARLGALAAAAAAGQALVLVLGIGRGKNSA